MQRADMFSRTAGTTAIYLARIGLDGSSGYHGVRRTMLELHIVNQALEAIKTRHRLEGFHLFGQSGVRPWSQLCLPCATTLAARLPELHRCPHETMTRSPDPARRYLDPSEFIAAIAANRSARILVVTDPADQTVPVQWQISFVRQLRRTGREIDQFFVQALDVRRHDVSAYSLLAVSECLRGSPTPDIGRKLAAHVQTMLARAAQARAVQ